MESGTGWKNIGLLKCVISSPLKNESHLPSHLELVASSTRTIRRRARGASSAVGGASVGRIVRRAQELPFTGTRFE